MRSMNYASSPTVNLYMLIGFQEVRIKVLDANNTSIAFKVLNGFPSLR